VPEYSGLSDQYEHIQLYRYSDRDGFVECLSCYGGPEPQTGGISSIYGNSYSLSDDGRTVAFVTDTKLDEEDINARLDVYEWHNGVTRLVTDGESEFSRIGSDVPDLWGLSENGETLIFSEGGVPITGNELDHLANTYAAVVGGPGYPPPNPPAHCVEDSCQGPLQPPPDLDTQGSEKFRGQDNPTPERGNGKKSNAHKKHKKKRKKKKKHGGRPGQARHSTHRHG